MTNNAKRRPIYMLKAILIAMLMATVLSIGSNRNELYLKVVFKGKGGVSTGRLLAAVNRPH